MFRFKQFTIHDDQCAMKVGTDGVLLGAWVNTDQAQTVLDIGTGSGMIALMLAQRALNTVVIDAIEIESTCAQQAMQNVASSPWADRINVYHSALQDFAINKTYDLIVSNPPYFQNSMLPPNTSRANARHANTLPLHHLISCVRSLLADGGRLAVVLPFKEGKGFISLASIEGLYCIRECSFFSRKGKKQERWLLEFAREPQLTQKEELVLHGNGETWSEDYQRLTRAFYLKL